jgi:hypothetical protein
MQLPDAVGATNTHRVKRSPPRRAAARNGHAKGSIEELIRMGRRLPDKLQRAMKTSPGTVLIAESSASFLAGVVLQSRLGRAALGLAIPFGLERLIESDLAPRLWRSVEDLLRETDGRAAAH